MLNCFWFYHTNHCPLTVPLTLFVPRRCTRRVSELSVVTYDFACEFHPIIINGTFVSVRVFCTQVCAMYTADTSYEEFLEREREKYPELNLEDIETLTKRVQANQDIPPVSGTTVAYFPRTVQKTAKLKNQIFFRDPRDSSAKLCVRTFHPVPGLRRMPHLIKSIRPVLAIRVRLNVSCRITRLV